MQIVYISSISVKREALRRYISLLYIIIIIIIIIITSTIINIIFIM